jgi:diguanylate cyclase (GGDEF)-like protein
MHAQLVSVPPDADPDQRREFTHYLAQRMRPVIHALMLVAVLGYVAATGASALTAASAVPLWLRLAPALPLLLLATGTARARRPWQLSALTLASVLLLEIGSNLNGIGRMQGLPWVMPGTLLIPVASAAIWLARWDFIAGMTLCGLGPMPMLLFGEADSAQVLPYLVYLVIAIALASVMRAFMTRTLFEHFRLERQLREQASTDGLTGLLLRNRFLELARLALDEARQQPRPVCMLYMDADRFKQLNDNHGHAAGDAALVALAGVLRRHTRQSDLVGRIGGEEFGLLLPGLDLRQASLRAELLRVAMHEVRRPDGPLTVSIGVATRCAADEPLESLLARADKAMRQAKADGRDRIVCA